MTQPSLKDLIGRNFSIPTLPDVVMKINRMIEDPDVGTAEIGSIVSEDAPLAAKVLRIANSAYYGLSGECVSTTQASTVLGIKVLKNIVTQVAVISRFDHIESSDDLDLQALWNHASFTGHLCSKIAVHSSVLRAFTPDEMYVCGLLHDVGKVVLLEGMGADYLALVRESVRSGHPLHQVEHAALSFTHTDVGAIVANKWGFPTQIANAIQYHHGPRDQVASNVVVSIVAHANLLAHRAQDEDADLHAVFDDATRDQIGLSLEAVSDLAEYAEQNANMTAV